MNVKVNIILPTPVNSNFLPKKLVKQSLAFNKDPLFPSSFYHDSEATLEVRNLLLEVSRKNKVNVIDPIASLCLEGNCPSKASDGRPFYKDNIHFRPFYVEENVIYLDSIFKY